jgi:hypothetical protein
MAPENSKVLACFALTTPVILYAQHAQQAQSAQSLAAMPAAATAQKKPSAPKMTDAQKIALAMSAGPVEIAKNAIIVDMTDMPNKQPKQLRAGTNGWACYDGSGGFLIHHGREQQVS